ncbi:histone-lysine N-methyltransferase SETMAR [Trichonephila clavipes]|nr:histone-lysine N-methyltransferase SETMAR [Trichonephila clavipes]
MRTIPNERERLLLTSSSWQWEDFKPWQIYRASALLQSRSPAALGFKPTTGQCRARTGSLNFDQANFDVEDAPRSGRPVEADKDAIKALVDANRQITTREIGLRLNLSNSIVYDHLKGLGLSSKLDVWVPHVLTQRNLCRRIDVCDSLLKRHKNYPFLKRITGDEKGHGAKKMNRLKPFPKPIFTKKR